MIKKWIKEILTGLDYLHSNNIIHHDIKCENIYLDRISGHLKIGCIGVLEKLQNGSESFENYLGTPEFMAPEVNEGKYNFKADIFSLGLTLIELLTVQKPYKECEGALNIYVNKKKGILPESFKNIDDKGIRDFILMCLEKEKKRPTAKEILDKNIWLNDKNISENNSIIEIKGALRQKNFYLNDKYKSGGNIAIRRQHFSNKNVIKYNSKMFNTFNLNKMISWHTNKDNSGNIKNINTYSSISKNNINNTTTSKTDNLIISNRSFNHINVHDTNENKNKNNNDYNSYYSNLNSDNISKDYSYNNLLSENNINIINFDNSSKNNIIIKRPIIKERNNVLKAYGMQLFNSGKYNNKKYFSPENKIKRVIIPHLNFGSIHNNTNNNNNFHKINSFRESSQYIINNISSSIKSIKIHYDENQYEQYEQNACSENDYYINYNIIYTIKYNDNKEITCEYNYEKDSVELLIKYLSEIMIIDANDIILLKNEFGKKIHEFMDIKKLKIFFNKYYLIMNKFKFLGNFCKKFDKIMNEKKIKNNENNNNKLNNALEKIKDFQMKKIIINNINNIHSNCNN